MNTRVFLFLAAILNLWNGISQTREVQDTAPENILEKEIRLQKLDSMIGETSHTDVETYFKYSREYIHLATDLKYFNMAAEKLLSFEPAIQKQNGAGPEITAMIDRLLEQPQIIRDSSLTGNLYIQRSNLISKKNTDSAIDNLNLALKYLSSSDPLTKADVHLRRADLQVTKDRFILAYDDYNSAYRLYESLGKHHSMIRAQQGITAMFSANGFNEKAIEERTRLIQIIKAFNLNNYLAEEYYNQAVDYRKLGNYDQSYRELLTAEKQANQFSATTPALIKIHSLFVSHYSFQKQLDEAKKHLDLIESLTFNEDDLISKYHYLNGRIHYLLAIDESSGALILAKDQLTTAEKIRDNEKIIDAHLHLAQINYNLRNYQSSIDNQRTASTLKDSVFTKSKLNALAYFQTLYETEKKERELMEQATSFSLLEKDNQNFKRSMLLGGVTLVLGFIIILLYRNHVFNENRRKMHELFSQKLLLSQEAERKRISENLHDGIGQQLLVIKNRIISSGDPEVKKLLDDAIEEVRLISRDLHPFLLKEMGITKAIQHTIQRIDENTKLFISTDIDNIDGLTTKENELNIYRIVQEAMSNILKHAHADAARVSIKNLGNSIIISIRDNGIGFDFNEKYEDAQSLGLKTLMERARFINGDMKVTSKHNGGTILEFQINV